RRCSTPAVSAPKPWRRAPAPSSNYEPRDTSPRSRDSRADASPFGAQDVFKPLRHLGARALILVLEVAEDIRPGIERGRDAVGPPAQFVIGVLGLAQAEVAGGVPRD